MEGTTMTESTYIMVIGQGTASSWAIISDKKGRHIDSPRKESMQYLLQESWVEHDTNEIWNSIQSVIVGTFIESGIKPNQIAGIGITDQRETTVIWEKDTGHPICYAAVWQPR